MDSIHGSEEKRTQVSASKNVYYKDASGREPLPCNPQSRSIALDGCSNSKAAQLLNERWEASVKCCFDPSIDISERPVYYLGNRSAWGRFRLPHQLMQAPSTGPLAAPQKDFLGELRRAMRNANATSEA